MCHSESAPYRHPHRAPKPGLENRMDIAALPGRVPTIMCTLLLHSGISSGPTTLPRRKDMSFVKTQPEMLSAAAGDLQIISSAMSAENAVAATVTTGVVPAAGNAVSALTALQFSAHAQLYQAIGAQA